MKIDRDLADAIYRTDFGAFACKAFEALNPGQHLILNWHIECICYQIQQMVSGEARKRLVLNLPPRTLKSFIVSVALPAWLLGRVPSTRIIAPATPTNSPPNSPGTAGRCSTRRSTSVSFRKRG